MGAGLDTRVVVTVILPWPMAPDCTSMCLRWELTLMRPRLYQRLMGQRLTRLPLTFPMTYLRTTTTDVPLLGTGGVGGAGGVQAQAAVAGQPEARLAAAASLALAASRQAVVWWAAAGTLATGGIKAQAALLPASPSARLHLVPGQRLQRNARQPGDRVLYMRCDPDPRVPGTRRLRRERHMQGWQPDLRGQRRQDDQ